MAYPEDDLPFGAVSPFGEVAMPAMDEFLADIGEVAPPPVDLSVPDVSPTALPSAESFLADMAAQEEVDRTPVDWSEAERLGQSVEDLRAGMSAPIPPEGEPIPLQDPDIAPGVDEFAADMAPEQEFLQPFEGFGEAGVLERPGLPVPAGEEFGEGLAPFEEEAPQPTVEDMSDEALAIKALRMEQEKEAERIRITGERMQADASERESNLKVYEDAHRNAQQETERIFADSKALAAEGVDNNRWWSSRSSGQRIANYAAVLLGGQLGLISGRGGNEAMKLIMGEIDKDIDAQKFNIQNRRAGLQEQQGLVSRLYQQSGNMYQATETARMAALQGMTAQIDNQLAQIDPEGTQAMSLEVKKRQMQQAQQAQAQKIEQAGRAEAVAASDREIKNRKIEAEIALKQQQAAKVQAEAAKLARRGRGGGGQKKKYMSPKQQLEFSKQGYEPYTIGGALVPTPGAEALRAQGPAVDKKAQAEEEKVIAEATVAKAKASGLTLNDNRGAPLINEDGTPVLIASDTTRQKLQSMTSAAYNMRRIADLAKILRNKSGGASEIIGSKEYQELTSAAAMMDFEIYKAFDLGAPSAGDQKMAADAKGGKDITSWIYEGSTGWDALASGVEDKLNTTLRVEGGYTGKDVKPPRQQIKKKTARTQRILEKDLLAPRLDIVDDDWNKYIEDKRGDIAAWVKTKPSNKQMAKMLGDMESSGMDRSDVELLSVPMVDLYRKQVAKGRTPEEMARAIGITQYQDLAKGKQLYDPEASYRLVTGGE